MKVSLAKIILMLTVLTSVSARWKRITVVVDIRLRGVQLEPSLSVGDTNPPIYYYQYNSTATVTTKSTTSLSSSTWLWIRLIPDLSTSEEKQFLVALLNSTDYQGNEEQLFNNTQLKHQPVFQIGQKVKTGEATTIRISKQLELNHLELARSVLSHISPTISESEANRLLLSTEVVPSVDDGSGKTRQDEKLTVINLESQPEGSDKGEGTRKIFLSNTGQVRKSTEVVTLETQGLQTLDGKGNPVGQAIPPVKLQVSDAFELKKIEPADSSTVDLAKSFLDNDKSVLAYTVESFDAMVDTVKKELADLEKASDKQSPANLRADASNPTDNINLTRAGEVNYELTTRREVLVEAPVIARILKLTLLTTVNYVILDGAPDSTFNKVGVTISLLFEFADKSLPVPITNSIDFIVPDYSDRPANPTGFWDIVLPIRFGDGRINFDMGVRLVYTVTSSHNLVKIGNQLTISRNVNVIVDCNAAVQTPNRGNIIGYAHFRGRVINIATSQSTVVILSNPLQVGTNFVATLNPFAYQLYQSFQVFGCWKRRFLWWGRRVWCNWSTAVDQWWRTTSPVTWDTKYKNTLVVQ